MGRAYNLDEDGYPLVPHTVAGHQPNEAEELLQLLADTEAALMDALDALDQDNGNPLAQGETPETPP